MYFSIYSIRLSSTSFLSCTLAFHAFFVEKKKNKCILLYRKLWILFPSAVRVCSCALIQHDREPFLCVDMLLLCGNLNFRIWNFFSFISYILVFCWSCCCSLQSCRFTTSLRVNYMQNVWKGIYFVRSFFHFVQLCRYFNWNEIKWFTSVCCLRRSFWIFCVSFPGNLKEKKNFRFILFAAIRWFFNLKLNEKEEIREEKEHI